MIGPDEHSGQRESRGFSKSRSEKLLCEKLSIRCGHDLVRGPRPCVFQLSTWFQEAGKVPLYTALLGQVKGLERVFLMMPSTVLVSYEGGGYANAQW